MKQSDFEQLCLGIQEQPPKIAFSRSASDEEVLDAIAGELLFEVRKFVGAHATRSIDPPAKGQPHSEARFREVGRVVNNNSIDFDPCVGINKLISAILPRRAKFKKKMV